jgi:methionyl aminopeptidase
MIHLRSLREVRLMRRAGLVVWQAHQVAAPFVQPGVETREIDAAIEAVFSKYNAQPLFRGVKGTKFPFPAVSCISINDQLVHGIPGERKLKDGDIVSIDTGCRVAGWCGDSAVTHPVGQISADIQKLLSVTRQALQLAIERLAVEKWWSAIARAMAALVEQAGFSVVENFSGHGIGREMHEPPQVPNFFSPQLSKNDIELRPGLVLAIEPMVNMGSKKLRRMSDTWTQATADGCPSAHFEHTVALTESGPWVLTGPPENDEERLWLRI